MKLVTFSHLHRTAPDRTEGQDTHVGVYLPMEGAPGRILNIEAAHEWLNKRRGGSSPYTPPMTMIGLLDGGPEAMERVRGLSEAACADEEAMWECTQPVDDVQLLAPVPFPRTIRDFYAFEQHVKTARGLRGLDMVPEWYEIPAFYFTNPAAIFGPAFAIWERPFKWPFGPVIGKVSTAVPFALMAAAVRSIHSGGKTRSVGV